MVGRFLREGIGGRLLTTIMVDDLGRGDDFGRMDCRWGGLGLMLGLREWGDGCDG